MWTIWTYCPTSSKAKSLCSENEQIESRVPTQESKNILQSLFSNTKGILDKYIFSSKKDEKNDKDILDNNLEMELKFCGWWGDSSALIDMNTLLYKLKMELLETLLQKKIITNTDLDNRNRNPHINLFAKKDVYKELNGCQIIINNSTLVIKQNYAEIKVGTKYHMTLIYANDIIKYKAVMIYLLNIKIWISVIKQSIQTNVSYVLAMTGI